MTPEEAHTAAMTFDNHTRPIMNLIVWCEDRTGLREASLHEAAYRALRHALDQYVNPVCFVKGQE